MSVHSSRGRPYYDGQREQVLERDGYRCRQCGKAAGRSNLEVHHVEPTHLGGSDDLGNLVTLCRGCHIRLEKTVKNPMRAEWEAYLGV